MISSQVPPVRRLVRSWTNAVSGTTSSLRAAVWTGTIFVVVGEDGTILTSIDGFDWTTRQSGTNDLLLSVVWNGRQLVAVGCYGSSLVSRDGMEWTLSPKNTGAELRSIIWADSFFIAVGQNSRTFGEGLILTSADGGLALIFFDSNIR